ncbi:MAG: hypothetical protein JJ902_04125 [Roseibium sp.]|nr:hypothetical protein [Roseibium sp.]
MSLEPLSDECLIEAVEALKRAGGVKAQAARDLGLKEATYKKRISIAAKRGLYSPAPPEAPPGMAIKTRTVSMKDGAVKGESIKYGAEPGEVFKAADGHRVKGESALVDPDGRVIAKWVKTAEDVEKSALHAAEVLQNAFQDYRGVAKPLPPPSHPAERLLTFYPLSDFHLGLYVWGQETGGENWNLKKAVDQIYGRFRQLIPLTPSSGECVILGGGDLFHSDTYSNTTRNSGHALDVDGRWSKVLYAGGHLLCRIVELALQHHHKITVRVLPGNHDDQSAIAVAFFLAAHFRLEQRVEVDCDPSLFWWHRFGRVMLGATHGHTVKIAKMPAIMAHRRAEDWGRTSFRYIHGFHLHHSAKTATEGEGVITEIHQSPVPQDAWHFGSGFLSGRSVCGITYHYDAGEIGRVRLPMEVDI